MKTFVSVVIFVALSSLVLISCISHRGSNAQRSPSQSGAEDRLQIIMPEELEDFSKMLLLLERAYTWKAESLQLYHRLSPTIENSQRPLSSAQIFQILNKVTEYSNIRSAMEKFISKYWTLATSRQKFEYAPYMFMPTPEKFEKTLNSNQPELYIDPTIQNGEKLIAQLNMALALKMTMHDIDIVGLYPYLTNDRTRHILTSDSSTTKFLLKQIQTELTSKTEKTNLEKTIVLLDKDYVYRHNIHQPPMAPNIIIKKSHEITRATIGYQQLGDYRTPAKKEGSGIEWEDFFYKVKQAITFALSKQTGNLIGFFAFRKGKLLNMTAEEMAEFGKSLKPLDILLQKSPFRLTDVTIPGYYGHVALWLGTEEDLRGLGIWDHPLVVPYQKDIREGKSIIQAERTGVEIANLKRFLDADNMLHIRPKSLTKERRARYLLNAFKQIGKEYDFNFDVETDKRIVCSEIIYVIYDDLNWPTSSVLKRFTISPDQVAERFLTTQFFVPVAMFNDGKSVQGDEAFFRRAVAILLSQEEEEIKKLFPPPPNDVLAAELYLQVIN